MRSGIPSNDTTETPSDANVWQPFVARGKVGPFPNQSNRAGSQGVDAGGSWLSQKDYDNMTVDGEVVGPRLVSREKNTLYDESMIHNVDTRVCSPYLPVLPCEMGFDFLRILSCFKLLPATFHWTFSDLSFWVSI